MKYTIKVVAVTILLLAFSVAGVCQNPNNPNTLKSHKLFDATEAMLKHVESVCKTDTCQDLIQQVKVQITETKVKYLSRTLFEDDRKKFHKDFGENLLKIQNELQKLLTSPEASIKMEHGTGRSLGM